MALENVTVLNNLKEQHATVEKQIKDHVYMSNLCQQNDGQAQIDQLRATYLRLSSAIEILQQIEDTNNPPPQED